MKNRFGLTVVISIFLITCIDLRAQDSLMINIKNEARQSFAENNYVKALPLFRELLRSFPKEPEYQYGLAVCLIKLNTEPEEAVRLLRAVTVTDFYPMAWYYLGRVFHLNYSFDEAITAYSRFLLLGRSSDIKLLEVERQIEMAKNGIDLTRSGRPVIVLQVRAIGTEQVELVAEINGSGKLMKKPLEFCTKSDLRNDYRSWMFLPVFTQINEYVYFTGFENISRNKNQLFRIRNINHETWGTPEPLDATINTPYDEEYPYFDTKTSTLYFSSDGHSSMGGLDIFKTVYDRNTKTWSKPENMGFPINSPYDDYWFITDEFNRSASFVSSRSTGPGQLSLYRIQLEQDTSGMRFLNVDEIRRASQLLAGFANPDLPAATEAELSTTPGPQGKADTVKVAPGIETPVKSDYNRVLASALLLQLRADSLSRITRDKRILARDTPDEALKKQLIAEIIQTDKEAKSYQRDADQKFIEARGMKHFESEITSGADSMITLDKEINGIKVFRYNTGYLNDRVADSLDLPARDAVIVREIREGALSEADTFALLESSPYSLSNPIPQGSGIHPGLIYRIQLGVFSKAKPYDAFGGISPIISEQAGGSPVIKYYAGLFHSLNVVTQALEQVRTKGFPDAFIVAFYDGKLISTEKAREIEFEKFKL